MKNVIKLVIVVVVFFATIKFMDIKETEQLAENTQNEINLAISTIGKMKNLDVQDGFREVLIGHIYAAYQTEQDVDKHTVLNDLYNTLIYNKDGVYDNADELITALTTMENIEEVSEKIKATYNELNKTADLNWEGDEQFAIVLLGYELDKVSQDEIDKNYNQYISKYFDINDGILLYNATGYENYLIIPRYPEKEINIYAQSIGDTGEEKGDLLYSIKDKKHFMIQCNESDIFSNIVIETKVNDGIITYSPYLSGLDGKVVTNEYVKSLE